MIPLVFCVDDDKVTLMLCKIVLKRSLFCTDVVTAENGQSAIEYFNEQLQLPQEQRKIPELILLDLNMPVVDGWGFLDSFMQHFYPVFNQVKVVILSSSINPADNAKAKEYPIVLSFLSKPLDAESLKTIQTEPSFTSYF